jgi:hypothetical protein
VVLYKCTKTLCKQCGKPIAPIDFSKKK